MATNRINITLDTETLETLDSIASTYRMNRSQCIRFMVDAMDELGAWRVLQSVGTEVFTERFGREPESDTVSPSMMLKAASRCSITRD